jgi:acyl-CoA thioesterase FadM
MARLGRSSATFCLSIYRANDTSATLLDAELIYVCVDPACGAPTGWPAPARQRMRDYETVPPLESVEGG